MKQKSSWEKITSKLLHAKRHAVCIQQIVKCSQFICKKYPSVDFHCIIWVVKSRGRFSFETSLEPLYFAHELPAAQLLRIMVRSIWMGNLKLVLWKLTKLWPKENCKQTQSLNFLMLFTHVTQSVLYIYFFFQLFEVRLFLVKLWNWSSNKVVLENEKRNKNFNIRWP